MKVYIFLWSEFSIRDRVSCKRIISFVVLLFCVPFFIAAQSIDSLSENVFSFSPERESVVVQVENYLSDSFYDNGYWESLLKRYKGNPKYKSALNAKLTTFMTPSQVALFKNCLAGGNVTELISIHEQEYKTRLDSLVQFYSANDELLAPLPVLLAPDDEDDLPHCENMNMEQCDFSNWTQETGRVNGVPYGIINRVVTTAFQNGMPVSKGLLHSIVSTPQTDPIAPIQVIKPGGSCSAVLGDLLGNGYRASTMRRTFMVTPENYFFSYSYAVIMHNPSNVHTPGQRPFFTVRMTDASGGELNCSKYEVYAGDGNPAWRNLNGGTTVYTDWTDAFIPLQAYIGQQVTIEFAVGDCNLGGHSAYAYVEANCGGDIKVEDTLICPGIPMEMIAPGGASSYLWSTGETTQSIMVSDSGLYTVSMGSTADNSCTTSLSKRMYLKKAPLGDFSADTVCVNTATTFIDKSLAASTGLVAWNWDFNNDGTVDGTGESVTNTYAAAGNHTVRLEVEDVNECKHDTTFTVHVWDGPTVDFEVQNACLGDSTFFVNRSTDMVSNQWDLFNDGATLSTKLNEAQLYTAGQTVKLSATSVNGCKDSITKSFVLNPKPVADFANIDVCGPSTMTFTNASNISGGAITVYDWNFGDPAIATDSSGVQNPSYTYNSYGNYNVELIVISDSLCADTIVKPVKYFEKPIVNFSVTDACPNEDLSMVNSSSVTSSTFVTWNWDIQNNGIVNYLTEHATHSLGTSGIDSIQLIGVTAEGCRDTIVKPVLIDTLPAANFSSRPVCLNEQSVFEDLSQGTLAKWEWDFLADGSVDATVENPTTTFTADGSNAVKLKVTTTKGCVDSVVLNALVNPLPVADFGAMDACFPLPIEFTNLSSVSSGAIANTSWGFGDGVGTSIVSSPSYQYSSHGTYTVQLLARSDSACLDSVSKVVTSFEKPVVEFSVNDTCQNEAFSMVNESVVATSTFTEWGWDILQNGTIDYTTENASHTLASALSDSIVLYGTTAEGCKDTVVHPITIDPLPTSFFAIPAVCFNEPSVFENKSQGTIVLYEWDFLNNGSVESNAANPTNVFVSDGSHEVELKLTTDKGCLDSLVLNAVVHPLPTAAFSFEEVCAPNTMSFVNESSVTTGSVAFNNWDFGDNSGTSSMQDPSYAYGTYGVYNVELKVTTENSCQDSITKSVGYFEKPVADFVFRDTCVFNAINFTDASSVASSTIVSWRYDVFNDGTVNDSTQNCSYIFTQNGQFDVELIISTPETCSDTVIKPVTVFAQPIAEFNFNNSCINDSIVMSDASTVDNDSIATWKWLTGDAGTYFTSDIQHAYQSEGIFTAQLEITTNRNCKDTVEHAVEVYPLPLPDFSPNEVCLNQATAFEDLSAVSTIHTANSIASWSWDFGDGSANILSQNPTRTYQTEGTFFATLVVETNNNCIDSIVKPVTVNALPDVHFTSSLPQGCSEWCVDFEDASTVQGGTVSSYHWDFENRTTTGEVASNCFENTSQELVYFDVGLQVTSDKGCVNDTLASDYVTVYPLSLAQYSYSPTEINDQEPTVNFTNESVGSVWFWDFDDGDTSNAHSPVHKFKEAGTYQVQLTANNQYNCPDSIVKPVIVKPTFAYYAPNAITPDGDGLNEIFYIYGYNIIDFELHVFDRWGVRLFTSTDMNVGWDGTYMDEIVQQDVYIYKAYLTDVFGDEHVLVGTVTVVR